MASRSTKKSKSKNNKRGNNGGGNRTKLTVKKMDAFIVLLDNNGGIVTDAAANLNLSRTCLYEKRTADAEFKERWDEAVEHGIDKLEDEAKRRALDGTEEPVYYQGEVVGYVMKKSDYLMAFLLKGHRAKYRKETHEITGADGKPLSSNVHVYLPENRR